jgi:cyclopropane-fatty-acyl-phospholipid synthase
MNYTKVIDEIFSQFKGSKLSVKLWDGSEFTYGKGKNKNFTLVFKNEEAVKRLLAQGSIGFGESYMDGSLSVEGDIEAYLRLRHQIKHIRRSSRLVKAVLISRMSTPRNRRDQIAHHYDLGNDFFQLFLDPETMSYSAGRYETGSESLEEAQQKKLELVCNWLDLARGAKVLDLGSGWGGFAKYAAQKHRWNVTGYTLSRAQLAYCRKLIKEQRLDRYATFKYKDMISDLPSAQYDAIVMIESIEHVSKDKLYDHFRQLYKGLKPGGSVYIQASGQYKRHSADRWLLKYVFPGGYLPPLYELIEAAGKAGFVMEYFRDDTPDYLKTLPTWIKSIEKNRLHIEDKFDQSFYRMWELWTHGAKVGFEINYVNLFRILFRRPE